MASILTFIDTDEGILLLANCIDLLQEGGLLSLQCNDRCLVEQTIVHRLSSKQLGEMFYKLKSRLFDCLPYIINESTKRCKKLANDGELSLQTQLQNEYHNNVPSVNDISESVIGQFKCLARKMKQANHTTVEGITCFHRNGTYNFFKSVMRTDADLYHKLIKTAIDKTQRVMKKLAKEKEIKMAQQLYEYEHKQNEHKQQKELKRKTKAVAILEKYDEIKNIEEFDNKMQKLTATKKIEAVKMQLRIRNIKYNCKIQFSKINKNIVLLNSGNR